MGALRWFGLLGLAAAVGCADDLDDEDPFLEERLDDEVVDPPTGRFASCEGLDGAFVSEEILLIGRLGQRDELGQTELVMVFDEGGTFATTVDDGQAVEGGFAAFGDRIVLSEPLFEGLTEPGVLDCALDDDRLLLRGPVRYDFPDGVEDGGALADLHAELVRAP